MSCQELDELSHLSREENPIDWDLVFDSEDNQTEDSKFSRVSDDYSHLSQEVNPIDWVSDSEEDSVCETNENLNSSQKVRAEIVTEEQMIEDILPIDSENIGEEEEVVINGTQFLRTVITSITAVLVLSLAVILLWY